MRTWIRRYRPSLVGLVLLYFGVRLLYEVVARRRTEGVGSEAPGGSIVRVAEAYARRVEYGYGGKTYAFDTPAVFALSLGPFVLRALRAG